MKRLEIDELNELRVNKLQRIRELTNELKYLTNVPEYEYIGFESQEAYVSYMS